MTLLDLEKRLSEGTPKASPALKTLMLKMKNLPFYHPTKPCFWYQIGAPLTYNGTPSPLWDYQQRIIGTLQTHKLVAVNKCRHSGLTELGLRFFLYMILCEQIPGNYLGIAATNLELSRDLARRMKAILAKHSVYFDERETTLTFPHCRVQFFPSNAENLRGYIPAAVLVDEFGHADFTSDIFATIDAFHIKNPQAPIYCITTPGRVGSNAHSLFTVKTSMYQRMTINYRDCINKTFSESSLELLKQNSFSFAQEFDNRFGYSAENPTFRPEIIDKALIPELPEFNQFSNVYMGWDVGFSAPSGACVGQLNDGFFQILYAKEFEQKDPDFNTMVDTCASLINEYNVTRCWIDGSSPSFITSVREAVGEERDYNAVITRNKQNKIPWDTGLRVCPIAFNKYNKDMLFTAKIALEKGGIQIPQQFSELIEALRTAKDSDGHLLKKLVSFNHVLDAFLLSTRGIEVGGGDN